MSGEVMILLLVALDIIANVIPTVYTEFSDLSRRIDEALETTTGGYPLKQVREAMDWLASRKDMVTGADIDAYLTTVGIKADTMATANGEVEQLRRALTAIASIEDKTDGGDWDEIEEAREIAREALAKKER